MTSPTEKIWDVIVLGAGGAGMMCAATAAYRGKSVLLVDQSEKLGKKILISGGGRCNFTNINARAETYFSRNPHFVKSALARFRPDNFLALIEKYKVPFYEKKLGQLFCVDSAQRIVDLLVAECNEAGVHFQLGSKVEKVEFLSEQRLYSVEVESEKLFSQSLVVATGGLSVPKTGASDLGYRIARHFQLKVTALEPALVGFTMDEAFQKQFGELSGVSIDSVVISGGREFRENILFTHTGLSGPAILQASLFWEKNTSITVNLAPDKNFAEIFRREKDAGNRKLSSIIGEGFTARFTDALLVHWQIPEKAIKEISDQFLLELAHKIHHWEIFPKDTAGFGKAEVTRGGVDTEELNSRTLETKKQPGLYFIGEVVDVTGMLGGYNFQWAWASGHAAGESV